LSLHAALPIWGQSFVLTHYKGMIRLRCAGPVVEPGPRRRPAEPQIVGSNPTRPALLLVLAKAGSVNSSYCCSVPFCWARLGIDGVTLGEIVGHEGRKDWPGNVNVGF